MRWLQFRHGVPFGVNDPILGHDIGFYVFRLPLFDLMQQIGVAVIIVAIIGSAAAYVLAGALNFTKRGGVSVVAQGAAASVAARRGVLPAARRQRVPAGAAPAHRCDGTRHRPRRVLRRRHGAHTGRARADGRGVAVGAALAAYHAFSTALWPVPLAIGLYLLTSVGGSLYAAGIQRFVVSPNEQAAETPYMMHNIDATRQAFNLATVRTRNFSGDAELTRERHRPQRRHDQERAPLGSPAAARYVRPDPGAAHVLRLRVGRQRSLHDQRRAPSGDAVGARAEFREPAEPHVDQRAPHLHARLRHHAGPGERSDAGRAADSVRQGHPAAVVGRRRHRREGAEHLLRRADEQLRAGEYEREGVSLLEGRRRRERRDRRTAAPTACASAGSAAGCSSASASSRCRFCSATTSPPTAACCTTGTSPTASRRSRRSCATTTTRIWWCRPTAGCSGFATRTRRTTRYPYSDARRPAASTTSATR